MIGPGADKKSNTQLNAVNLEKSHKKREEVLPPNKNGAVQKGGGASQNKKWPYTAHRAVVHSVSSY